MAEAKKVELATQVENPLNIATAAIKKFVHRIEVLGRAQRRRQIMAIFPLLRIAPSRDPVKILVLDKGQGYTSARATWRQDLERREG